MIQPLHKRLILQPNSSDMRGTIFIPKQFRGAATACLVIASGKDVLPFLKPGETVLCEVGFGERENNVIEGTDCFLCKENNIYGLLKNGRIFPIGRRVVIRRDMGDDYHGTIVIPENRRYQSLTGTIVRLGLFQGHFKTNGLTVGSRIHIGEWNESMAQIELEDGSHGLIVNEKDIIFKYED